MQARAPGLPVRGRVVGWLQKMGWLTEGLLGWRGGDG
jgi:hypothetical protein